MGYTPTLGTRPEDLGVNQFSPTGGAGSQTEYNTVYDRPIPEMTTVFTRHVGYFGFSTMLKSMGFSRGKATPTTGHYEQPWQEDLFTVNAIITAAAGAGNDIVVEITAGSMYDTSQTVNGVATQTSYPIVTDVIECYDGVQARITAKNTAVTPHRFTLTPLKAADNLDTSVLVAEPYHIVTNLHGEGTGLPATRAPRVIKWDNTFGIVKSAFKSSGTEWTNLVYFEPTPGATDSVNVMVEKNTLYHFERGRDGLLLFGQQADNITEFASELGVDVAISGSEGFVPFAKTNGTIDTYTLGSYGLADLDSAGNILEDERATQSNDLMCWDGTDITTETENAFQQVLVNNLVPFVNKMIPGYAQYSAEQFASKDEAIDWQLNLGFTAARKRGFNFIFKKLPVFSDIRRAGAAGYKYKNTRIICPLDSVTNRATNEDTPMVGYEYKSLNGYSREMVLGELAGVGVANTGRFPWQAVNQYDVHQMGLVCEIAGHWACGNKIVYQEPA
jgi:hypothetical protein